MASLFDEIASAYCQPFQSFTPSQEKCRIFTQQHLPELLAMRQREKYINEVRVCVAGLGKADEEEPLEEECFSQFQFYSPFTMTLVFFADKFDFLVKCVAAGVCRVQPGFEERYLHCLLTVLTFRELQPPVAPEQVLDLRQVETPRTYGELVVTYSPEKREERVDSYRTRRRSFSSDLKAQLLALEAEQALCEEQKGKAKQQKEEQDHPVDWGSGNEDQNHNQTAGSQNAKPEKNGQGASNAEDDKPAATTEEGNRSEPATAPTTVYASDQGDSTATGHNNARQADAAPEAVEPTPLLYLLASVAAESRRAMTPSKKSREEPAADAASQAH